MTHFSIAWKELYAIVIAASAWGSLWSGKRILFHCDNRAVRDIWKKRSTKDKHLMQLVRVLYYVAASHNVTVSIAHIAGTDNSVADALSRGMLQKLQYLRPYASPQPTPQ